MARNKTIKISCSTKERMGLPLLEPLQGDLKSIDLANAEKLKTSILKEGFFAPLLIWEDSSGALKIIDGHQRVAVLKRMQEEGYSIPEIPITLIKAETEQEAKRKVAAAISVYGVVNDDALKKWFDEIGVGLEEALAEFEIPGIELGSILGMEDEEQAEPYQENESPVGNVNSGLALSSQVRMVQLFFNGETQPEFLQMCQHLQNKWKTENLTDTVMEAVREAFKS